MNPQDSTEIILFQIPECFVYSIPPRTTAKGYKASDWDVDSPLWSGKLKLSAKGPQLAITLIDRTNGDVFGSSPMSLVTQAPEPVSDSSRYFVLKLVDEASKKYAYVGLGFPDRSDSFDLNASIQDFFRKRDRKIPSYSQPVVSVQMPGVVPPDPAVVLPTLPPPPRYEPSVTIRSNASDASHPNITVAQHTGHDDDEFGDFVGT